MKARHIRKLRKRISKWDAYDIHDTVRMFGSPYHAIPEATIKAGSPCEAVARFFRWYKRRYKKRHDEQRRELIECTEKWGLFKVVNQRTGFQHFER